MKTELTRYDIKINGISVEISNHKRDGQEKSTWCYYLIIKKQNLENNFKKLLVKKYYTLDGVFNMHCGITYYEKLRTDKGIVGVKVGCDYAHIHDMDREYSYEQIYRDAEDSVESFLANFPDYKLWCCGNGKFYSKEEGEIKDGQFYSNEYWKK